LYARALALCTVAVVLVPAVRATVARWLEEGTLSGRCSRALARAHAPFASRAVARPLDVRFASRRAELVTITVGGATLGGSGKTRVALACVRELARHGANVVLVGHAYRAVPARARVVSPNDRLADVGDEALACARALASERRARVVVGATRQAAVDLAASLSPHVDAIVIDGPLQLAPERSTLALLAVDADAPWGAGDVPPAGDLRAPREALLASADHVVPVDATPRGLTLDGRAIDLATLAASVAQEGSRLGLFTAIARPDRLERALERLGLAPHVVVRAADHGPLTAQAARRLGDAKVDLWLATSKCAVHLEALSGRIPLAVLDGSVPLSPAIVAVLGQLARVVGATPTSVA
jgi:tetraacyldisaccharide 4'-kinase